MFGQQNLRQGRTLNGGFAVIAPEGPDYRPSDSVDVDLHSNLASRKCRPDSVLLLARPERVLSKAEPEQPAEGSLSCAMANRVVLAPRIRRPDDVESRLEWDLADKLVALAPHAEALHPEPWLV